MMKDLPSLVEPLQALLRQTGEFIWQERQKVQNSDVELKSLNSLVSYVDREAEKMLVEALAKLLPEAGFLTEEETVQRQEKEWQWIIDPLDGTTNFLHGLPLFSISLALCHHHRPVLGLVYELGQKELFWALEGQGAWLDSRRLQVSRRSALSQSLLATGFPYYDFAKVTAFNQFLAYLYPRSRGLRRFGSAAVDMAYVACGRFEAYFEYGLQAWDIAAGALLVKEAGGLVSDFQGGDNWLFGGQVCARSAHLEPLFFEQLQAHFAGQTGEEASV